MASVARRFVSATLKSGKLSDWCLPSSPTKLFRDGETEMAAFVDEFIKQYGKLPSPDTFTAGTGVLLPEAEEPPLYYRDLMQSRHIELGLKLAVKEASKHLGFEKKDPSAALQLIADAVSALYLDSNAAAVADFRDAFDLVMADFKAKHFQADELGVRTHFPTLDTMAGGFYVGDLVSVVGTPGSGKTFFLLRSALSPWQKDGKTVFFVSMEMNLLGIQQRLSAMHLGIPVTEIKSAQMSTNTFKSLAGGLVALKKKDRPFWVVDGNLTASVDDIQMYARQLKPDLIVIDGAYMLQGKERDMFKRVGETSNAIKKALCPIAPVIASYQFNKDAAKKKNTGSVSLEDIGYSYVIAQVSSVILGLFEEETAETEERRRIRVLKGRSGEAGEFQIKWDFQTMNFGELTEADQVIHYV